MHDLIGAYQRLARIYQLYIKSAFPLRYRALAEDGYLSQKNLQQENVMDGVANPVQHNLCSY